MDIPVEISKLIITELSEQQVVFLREVGGYKSFPIIIGINEAIAIDRKLKDLQFPRPLTHDLLAMTISALGAKLDRIIITDVSDDVFFSSLILIQGNKQIEIDCRPSDALAIAAGTGTPIFADEKVIAQMTEEEQAMETKEDRLNVLAKRREFLIKMIAEAQDLLTDDEFLHSASPDIIANTQSQLAKMKIEFEAINDILDKFS